MATIGTGWVDGAWIQAGWATGAWSSVATATVSGTVTTATEAQIVAGGLTVVVDLVGDTWVAAGATFNAQRQAIIDGLDSAQAEATGWNAEVRDKEVVTAVARTSNTKVTITLTAAAAYGITANETITVTVPAAALTTSAIDVTGSPTFGVTAAADVAANPSGGGGKGHVIRPGGRVFAHEPEKKKPKPEAEIIPFKVSGAPGQIMEGADLPPDMPLFREQFEGKEEKPPSLADIQQLIADALKIQKQESEAKAAEQKEAAEVLIVQQKLIMVLEREESDRKLARDTELMLLLLMLE